MQPPHHLSPPASPFCKIFVPWRLFAGIGVVLLGVLFLLVLVFFGISFRTTLLTPFLVLLGVAMMANSRAQGCVSCKVPLEDTSVAFPSELTPHVQHAVGCTGQGNVDALLQLSSRGATPAASGRTDGMLLFRRSVLGLVALTSLLVGCGSSTVVQSGVGGSAGTSRALSFAAATACAYPKLDDSFVERIHALDFDGDGHLDLAVVAPGAPLSFMRNAGDGTFEDTRSSSFLGRDVTAADLNGDGLDDIIVTDDTFTDRNTAMNDGVWAIYGTADGALGKPVQISNFSTNVSTRIMSADLDGGGDDRRFRRRRPPGHRGSVRDAHIRSSQYEPLI